MKNNEKTALSLNQQAAEIKKLAEDSGVQSNFFFLTTFERYETQIQLFARLKKTVEEEDTFVTKEYVKGRENVYLHPAIKELNNTVESCNRTVSTLLRIIRTFNVDDSSEEDDLMKVINGSEDD